MVNHNWTGNVDTTKIARREFSIVENQKKNIPNLTTPHSPHSFATCVRGYLGVKTYLHKISQTTVTGYEKARQNLPVK